MFGISLSEFILIVIVIFLFIPPKELPQLIRKGASLIKKIKESYAKFLREINLLDSD